MWASESCLILQEASSVVGINNDQWQNILFHKERLCFSVISGSGLELWSKITVEWEEHKQVSIYGLESFHLFTPYFLSWKQIAFMRWQTNPALLCAGNNPVAFQVHWLIHTWYILSVRSFPVSFSFVELTCSLCPPVGNEHAVPRSCGLERTEKGHKMSFALFQKQSRIPEFLKMSILIWSVKNTKKRISLKEVFAVRHVNF